MKEPSINIPAEPSIIPFDTFAWVHGVPFTPSGWQEMLDRFFSKIAFGPHWIWTGAMDESCYGNFHVGQDAHGKKQVVRAHVVAYILSQGPVPAGREVLHECDTPPCVRPTHLRVGTHGENMADAARKGRDRWEKQRTRR